MDDLYQNAWTSSIDHDEDITGIAQSTWKATKSPAEAQDGEADLAAPSWSTGADIRWNEPSEASGFSWSHTEPDLAWNASTYDDIQLGPSSQNDPSDVQTEAKGNEEEQRLEEPKTNVPVIAQTPTAEIEENGYISPVLDPASPSKHSPVTTPTLRPTSPDGFGTFTSALETVDSTNSFAQDDIAADTWGSAWESGPAAADEPPEQSVDEWEAAKQQKARLDRKVVSQCWVSRCSLRTES